MLQLLKSLVKRQSVLYRLPKFLLTALSPFAEDSLAALNKSAFADGSYPLTRRLFVVIKRDGRLDEQAVSLIQI
jgi:uncharacterized protein YozE (UPF0346 family)